MRATETSVEVAVGVRLAVRGWMTKRTTAGGTTYLLVHGLSSNARLWDQVAVRLSAAGHPVYAVDLRSHGESDATADGHDTSTAADDLAAVCAKLRLRRIVAVGQSWGGNVVVRLAAKHQELVAALALVDGGWIDLSTEFRVTSSRHIERRLSIQNHMRIVRSMWDDPPWPDLPKIDAPVMLLPALPADDAGAAHQRARVAKAASALSPVTVREYVGADHDLHAQHPAELAVDLLTLANGWAV